MWMHEGSHGGIEDAWWANNNKLSASSRQPAIAGLLQLSEGLKLHFRCRGKTPVRDQSSYVTYSGCASLCDSQLFVLQQTSIYWYNTSTARNLDRTHLPPEYLQLADPIFKAERNPQS